MCAINLVPAGAIAAGQPEKGILTKNWDETVVMMLIIIHCDVVQDIIHFMQ